MADEIQDDLKIEDDFQEDEILISYDIATYPSDFTLDGLYNMWLDDDIIIPDFQREFVWTIKQSSLLIESFLLGLPVPPVFFYIDEENKSLVIDGQQRILSFCFYFEGYFGFESTLGKRQVFRLHGLDERNPFHNKKFSDLTDSNQRKLKNTVLRAVNIRQLSPKGDNTSIYHIFERLNTGGTPLKPQEIRNCVFRGNIVSMLRDLNKNEYWRKILGKKPFDKHQKDVELVLRTFALSRDWSSYEKPMKQFLNEVMMQHRKGEGQKTKRFVKEFPETARFIVENLGEKPFHVRGPLNSSVLDSVFCTIMDNIDKIPTNLPDRYKELLATNEFSELTSLGTTDRNVLTNRFKLVKKYLIE